jgi:hypothetical protein
VSVLCVRHRVCSALCSAWFGTVSGKLCPVRHCGMCVFGTVLTRMLGSALWALCVRHCGSALSALYAGLVVGSAL